MSDVTALLVAWVVTTGLTFAIVIVHERFMSEERLERAWPPVSRDAAIVAFGPLALPFHFAKTLGHFKSAAGVLGVFLGLAVGLVAVLVVVHVSDVVLSAIEALTSR